MRSYKYQLFNFLLGLKAAFTKLAHIRVHEFLLFPLLRSSFECFSTKLKFRSSFECFSRIRSTVKTYLRAKKINQPAMFPRLSSRVQCFKNTVALVTIPSQMTTFRYFFELGTKLSSTVINLFVFMRDLSN